MKVTPSVLNTGENNKEYYSVWFNHTFIIDTIEAVDDLINEAFNSFIQRFEDYNQRGSGGIFVQVKEFNFEMKDYKKTRSGHYQPIPRWLS